MAGAIHDVRTANPGIQEQHPIKTDLICDLNTEIRSKGHRILRGDPWLRATAVGGTGKGGNYHSQPGVGRIVPEKRINLVCPQCLAPERFSLQVGKQARTPTHERLSILAVAVAA